jgi:GT2 family glycosyltransferase
VDLAFPSLAESRARLLAAIGEAPDLTLVRGEGNVGDELIWAGTRELLDDHVYREIGLEELGGASGSLAVIMGGGAWCRPYHELMPRALAIAELRFERVVVLPSSFDPGEDEVRSVLRRTRAIVFAREPESLRRITGLCDARLAHDCAFFYPWQRVAPATKPTGTLNAFRTDLEQAGHLRPPPDSVDISLTAGDLDDWLDTIASHEHVRTDRAHVMIAAAMLGRSVEWAPSSTAKVRAIAESALRDLDVRPIPIAAPAETPRRTDVSRPPGDARVTAVILSRDRPELVGQAVRSVTASGVSVRALVIDNNSSPPARATVARLVDSDPRVDVRLADRNLGCAGGRRLGAELAETEYVLFLDDDAELRPGALEALVADLDAHPEAGAVTALVLDRDGRVFHFGGWIEAGETVVAFTLDGRQRPANDPSLPATGPSGWVPGTAALVRTELLRSYPLDLGMAAYYEDNEWCYRVALDRPAAFRRCREAVAVHHFAAPGFNTPFPRRSATVERLAAYARFHERHGRLMDVDFRHLLPELCGPDGEPDWDAARLLLELVTAKGTDWVLAEWYAGGLAPLFERDTGELRAVDAEARADEAAQRAEIAEQQAELVVQTAAAAEAARADLAAEVARRDEALREIRESSWWRLHARLLPAIRLARAVERRIRR